MYQPADLVGCSDEFVWKEIIRFLENPTLVQGEIDRRQQAAQNADPLRKREEAFRREQARLEKRNDRLVSAYQEGLVALRQLRQRIPGLRKQAQAVKSELESPERLLWIRPGVSATDRDPDIVPLQAADAQTLDIPRAPTDRKLRAYRALATD